MSDACDLKHIGKLGEELGEAQQVVCRCIIQGIDQRDPTSDISNRVWLEKELADVLANIDLVIERFGLDKDFIEQRREAKKPPLREWHKDA